MRTALAVFALTLALAVLATVGIVALVAWLAPMLGG